MTVEDNKRVFGSGGRVEETAAVASPSTTTYVPPAPALVGPATRGVDLRAVVVDVPKLKGIPRLVGKLRPWLLGRELQMFCNEQQAVRRQVVFITDGDRLWRWSQFPYQDSFTWEEFLRAYPEDEMWCVADPTRPPVWPSAETVAEFKHIMA